MRLDQYLVQQKLAGSRARAQRLISLSKVVVNEQIVKKSSYVVGADDKITLLEADFKWASRAAFKLLGGIEYWSIPVEGKTCLDVGASTGGFTQVLLDRGALKVVALDVGHGQLVDSLRHDPRVEVLEKTDIRDYQTAVKFDLITVDVSFISLKHILPVLPELLKEQGQIVCLIKPQFEVGPENINTRGLVSDKSLYEKVKTEVLSLTISLGFKVETIIDSSIDGADGNQEFLMTAQWFDTKI